MRAKTHSLPQSLLHIQPHSGYKQFQASYFTNSPVLVQNAAVEPLEQTFSNLLEQTQTDYAQSHLIRAIDPTRFDVRSAMSTTVSLRSNKFDSVVEGIRFLAKIGLFEQRYLQAVLPQLIYRTQETGQKPGKPFAVTIFASYRRQMQILPHDTYYRCSVLLRFLSRNLRNERLTRQLLIEYKDQDSKDRYLSAIVLDSLTTRRGTIQSLFGAYSGSGPQSQYHIQQSHSSFMKVVQHIYKQYLFYLYLILSLVRDVAGLEAVGRLKQQLDCIEYLNKQSTQLNRDIGGKMDEMASVQGLQKAGEAQLFKFDQEVQRLERTLKELRQNLKLNISLKETERMKAEDQFGDSLRVLAKIQPKILQKQDEVRQRGNERDAQLKLLQQLKTDSTAAETIYNDVKSSVLKQSKQYEAEQNRIQADQQRYQKHNAQQTQLQRKTDEQFAAKWKAVAEGHAQQFSAKFGYHGAFIEIQALCQQFGIEPPKPPEVIVSLQQNPELKPKDQLKADIDNVFGSIQKTLQQNTAELHRILPAVQLVQQQTEHRKQLLQQQYDALAAQQETYKQKQLELRAQQDGGQKWRLVSAVVTEAKQVNEVKERRLGSIKWPLSAAEIIKAFTIEPGERGGGGGGGDGIWPGWPELEVGLNHISEIIK